MILFRMVTKGNGGCQSFFRQFFLILIRKVMGVVATLKLHQVSKTIPGNQGEIHVLDDTAC